MNSGCRKLFIGTANVDPFVLRLGSLGTCRPGDAAGLAVHRSRGFFSALSFLSFFNKGLTGQARSQRVAVLAECACAVR